MQKLTHLIFAKINSACTMKVFTVLLLTCMLFVVSVYTAEQKTQSIQSTSYGAFPCSWAGEVHVSLIESQVYQCVNVRGRAAVDYMVTPVPKTNDKFSIALLNYTEYIHWSNRQPYACINGQQCELKDSSMKKGSYLVDFNGDDVFIVISDQNRVERAFVNTAVRVYSP